MQIDIISPEELFNLQGNFMLQPSDVNKILTLHSFGWGSKRISKELGISRGTVKKYLRKGEWQPPSQRKSRKLAHLDDWLKNSYEKHRGNADVVRQELIQEHGIHVHLRTVERAVQKWRHETLVKAKATIRFETPPGKQLQIDFGSIKILIGEEKTKIHLFIATLGYSRRIYIAPFLHERQHAWFKGMEGAFSYFGGIPEEVLIDNAKALVTSHQSKSEVLFNDRFKAFANYWGFKPVACSPYRARTKGKDERMVGYVKRNAIAGHYFPHFEAFKEHLDRWAAEIADLRIHGTTEEKPLERFIRDEIRALKRMPNKPPFIQMREVSRKVHMDACIELDTNYYSVPANLIGENVVVQVIDNVVKIFHNDLEVASHLECEGRRERILKVHHLKGIVGAHLKTDNSVYLNEKRISQLQRPLAEYEAIVGGGW